MGLIKAFNNSTLSLRKNYEKNKLDRTLDYAKNKSKIKLQFFFLFDIVLTVVKYAPLSSLNINGFYMFKSIKNNFQILNSLFPKPTSFYLWLFNNHGQ